MLSLSIRRPLVRRDCRGGLRPADAGGQLGSKPNHGDLPMRVMVIVKASPESEAGVLPNQELLADMGKFNDELVKAGVMLAGEGLQASSNGKRVRFDGKKRTVID